ncbi:MAG: type IV pilus biogenesis/stability protein PilW [Pseudomonadota bacterium]
MKPGLALYLVPALCALALAACAGSSVQQGSKTELKTASDQTPGEKRAGIRLQLAIGYYQDGKMEVALDEVKQAIAADPEFADAYGMRALIYTAMGELTLADDNYQRALKLAPRNPDLANNYGSFLCQNGRTEKGIEYFQSALKNPTYQSPIKAMLNAASCSLRTRNFDAAERYLLDALRIEPEHPTTNANLARVYYERRDMERAGFFINRLKTSTKLEAFTADQLWLAIRIDHKLADRSSEASMVTQLKRRFPGSAEFAAFQRGAFDE